MIQNHDHNFDRYRSSISLLDEQLYCLLSFVPLLQPVQFSLSGADDKPLIALSTTLLSIAIDDNIFQVQLFVTRNILLPVVLGIDFLQTHGRIISFPTKQLYLTTSSSKLADKPINTNRIYNTYTPSIHTPIPYYPLPHITVPPNHPYHVINTARVTIPARKDTIMTIPCTLPLSGNYLFEPSALALRVYDPLFPKNTSLIQTVTHAHCYLAINASECTGPLKNPNTIPWVPGNFLYCHISYLHLPLLATC